MLKFVGYVIVFILGFAACAGIYSASAPSLQSHSALLASTAPTALAEPTTGPSVTGQSGTTTYAVAAVEPSVVNIDITGRPVLQQPDSGPFGLFGLQGGREVTPKGVASGVIISKDGYILTNNHVAGDAASLTVTLHDGQRMKARVVGLDPRSDLAVIKVDGHNLPTPKIGNSANVQVGQWVIAVGDPLGIGTTATAGIISAVRSPFHIRDKVYPEILQTDAPINPGNSGGALADLNGDIIGINSAIATTNDGSIGIGFSIPITMAMQHAEEMIHTGHVSYSWMGIGYVEQTDQKLPVQGVLVSKVTPAGPADRAGMQPGDIITKVNGRPIDEPDKVNFYTLQHQPGQTVTVTVWRNGSTQELKVTLGQMPESIANQQAQQDGQPVAPGSPYSGP